MKTTFFSQNFLMNIEAEIRDVVRRLGHHPSIVLWSGNNENQVSFRGHWVKGNASEKTYTISCTVLG